MGRLSGKVAVVTGGASGMGAATVRRFVGEGARVVIADLQVDKGEAIAAECGEATSFIATDVGVEADVAAMVACAVDRFGRLDCLYNNAGFGGVSGTIDETDMGEPYARTVAGLLTGPVLGMKHAAPIMKAQGSGSIISTASVAGLRGGMGPHVYSALKAAVIGLTRSVAVELAPSGVRVNAICPGGIMTPIFLAGRELKAGANVTLEEVLEPAFAAMQPVPRAGTGKDIADMALFLASDDSTFVTGQALVVDGGLTVGRRRQADPDRRPVWQALQALVDED
ncbi:MAG: glucose 1-dehydrogenase [Gammaproteobacteria bacterium]|nr:glucose 1-dehydrogenase [Gammaproteobacteria bacterium]